MTLLYVALRNLVGFLYPSYKAFKVTMSRARLCRSSKLIIQQTLYHPDPTKWESFMEHFIVLSCFMAFELVSDLVLFWIPFYESLKLVLVIWLSVPFFGVGPMSWSMLLILLYKCYIQTRGHT